MEADSYEMFVGCPEFKPRSAEFLCLLRCLISGRERFLKPARPLIEQIQNAAARFGAGAQPQLLLKFVRAPTSTPTRTTDAAANCHADSDRALHDEEIKEEEQKQAAAAAPVQPRSSVPFQQPSPAAAAGSAAKRGFSQMQAASTPANRKPTSDDGQRSSSPSSSGSAGVDRGARSSPSALSPLAIATDLQPRCRRRSHSFVGRLPAVCCISGFVERPEVRGPGRGERCRCRGL